MGGEVRAAARPGGGAEFTVSVPLPSHVLGAAAP